MRKHLFSTLAAAALMVGLAPLSGTAQAQPWGGGPYAGPGPVGAIVPFLFGGRRYCWYDSAWRGPGWYWCGYAWHRGYGWGGPYGWHGHGGRGHGWHGGGRGWHGGGRGWRGGGWHGGDGDHHEGGGWHRR